MAGLHNVPESAKDAARGMGLTDRQMLWKVEIPLAVPEIIGGLRVATVSTVALATLASSPAAAGSAKSPQRKRTSNSRPRWSSRS